MNKNLILKIDCVQCHRLKNTETKFQCECGMFICSKCSKKIEKDMHISGKCRACAKNYDYLLNLSGMAQFSLRQSSNGGTRLAPIIGPKLSRFSMSSRLYRIY